MEKLLVHSSTNSHYVTGAENVVPEKEYTIPNDKVGGLVHNEHDTLCVLPSKHVHIGFVGVYDYVSGIIEKVRD